MVCIGFYVNLPIGAVVGVLLFFTRIPDQKAKPPPMEVLRTVILRKFDLIGFALFAPASVMFLIALEFGGTRYAWNSPTIINLFWGAGVTYAIFIAWEHRVGEDAMIPGAILRNRIILCSCFISMLVFGMTMAFSYYVPIYFQAVQNKSAITSGVDMLPSVVFQIVAALVAGILSK